MAKAGIFFISKFQSIRFLLLQFYFETFSLLENQKHSPESLNKFRTVGK